MAYDDELAARVRVHLAEVPEVVEKRMFGGLAFMVGGTMALSVGAGGLLVRRTPEGTTPPPGARPAVMGSREMHGWLAVDADASMPDADLTRWVGYALQAHQETGSSATP